MPVRIQVPLHCWPRSAEDLKTIDQRLGGKTYFVLGPKVEREVRDLDGKVRRRGAPSFVQFWLEYIPAAPAASVPSSKPVKEPKDERVREFIKALARRSAKAWAKAALQSVGKEDAA
jgi:hypothetical protein